MQKPDKHGINSLLTDHQKKNGAKIQTQVYRIIYAQIQT
jgi:hypothetical protein